MEVRLNAEKYARNASNASGDYLAGAQSPRRSQSAAAIASEGNYEAGVQAAIGRKAYSAGLRKSGDGKWQKGILDKGRSRYQQGVTVAKDEYAAGFSPYASILSSLTLQPRGPKGTNYGRVQAVGDALRAKKVSG